MKAMDYEYLIRAAFRCRRTRAHGADADIYRQLQRASLPLPGQDAVDKYKLGIKIGQVSAYLYAALYEVREQYPSNETFISKISVCLRYLNEPSLDNINKCIEESQLAFGELELFVGQTLTGIVVWFFCYSLVSCVVYKLSIICSKLSSF